MDIRLLQAADAPCYQSARLRALQEEPLAFLTTAAEYQARPLPEIAQHLAPSQNSFTVGGFVGEDLSAIATLARQTRPKLRHRADITGVYVTPEQRGQGLAEAVLRDLIARAKQLSGLSVLELGVTETQVAARHLYTRLGFEVWGVQPAALQEGGQLYQEHFMQLRL